MLDEGHATASPDSLTSVTGSVLHLWREWGALPDLPVLMMISGQMSWSTQCCLWAHVPLKDTRAPCQPHEVGFWRFGPICAWVACWRSLCIVSLLFLFVFTQRSRYQSCCWVDVLVSFPHSSECTGKHQKKPSYNGTYRFATLGAVGRPVGLNWAAVISRYQQWKKQAKSSIEKKIIQGIRRGQRSVATTC